MPVKKKGAQLVLKVVFGRDDYWLTRFIGPIKNHEKAEALQQSLERQITWDQRGWLRFYSMSISDPLPLNKTTAVGELIPSDDALYMLFGGAIMAEEWDRTAGTERLEKKDLDIKGAWKRRQAERKPPTSSCDVD